MPGDKVDAAHVRGAGTCGLVPATACNSAVQHRARAVGRCGEGRAEEHPRVVYNLELSRGCVRACMYRTRRTDGARRSRISWEKSMKRTAQELADFVGGELRGDGRAVIDAVASLRNAEPSDLSYAEEKFKHEVENSRAGCIIVQSGDWPSKTVIIALNPK